MADVVIYGMPVSNFVRACCMTALEKGASFERDHTSFRDLFTDRHRAVHPFQKVPSMRHGEVLLWESVPIMRYLDHVFGEPDLLEPAGFMGRIRHQQWLSAIADSVDDHVIRRYALEYVFPKGPDKQPDRVRIEKALPAVRRDLAVLDAALAASEFLVGNRLSLADILLHNTLAALPGLPEGPELLDAAPNLARAMALVSARTSFQGAVPPPREARQERP